MNGSKFFPNKPWPEEMYEKEMSEEQASKSKVDDLIDLLKDCHEDEIAHLRLRKIRDAQAPRFEAMKDSHPDIYRDFVAARNGPHEILLRNRRKRVEVITRMIEQSNEANESIQSIEIILPEKDLQIG